MGCASATAPALVKPEPMLRRRAHGLQAPWSQEQMLTLAGYILLAATFYAVAGAAMEDSRQRVASIVLNVVCTCVVFACWIYTELTDPSLEVRRRNCAVEGRGASGADI